jgi:hypothetical protein
VVFAQHGHGTALYEAGREQLLFLVRIQRVRELGAVAAAAEWTSLEEHEIAFPLEPPSGAGIRDAARAYAALAAAPDGDARRAALRATTARLLASKDARLARSALRDLVAPGGEPLLGPAELPLVLPVVDSPEAPIGLRVGLLAELERRRLVDAPPRWAALLRSARGDDLAAVARASAAHPSPEVTGALLEVLAAQSGPAAESAAVALGVPGNRTALGALADALARGDARLRSAAVRGIGGVGGDDARALLERAGATHPDPATRRLAAAESARLARGRW